MNKEKVEFSKDVNSTINFSDKVIFVKSFIGFEDEIMLCKNYVATYFEKSNESVDFVDRYISAKYSLILGVVDLCTNIDIENKNKDGEDEGIDINNLICSGLWEKIMLKISNYKEVEDGIKVIVKKIEDQIAIEKSIGSVIDNFSKKFMDFISEIDLSPESMDRLAKELRSFGEDGIESRLSNILEKKEG